MKEISKSEENIYETVEKILQITDYKSIFNSLDEIERISKLENIQELVNSAREFLEKNEETNVANYLDTISLYTDIDNTSEDDDSVLIMTVHNAKGLEFKTVFIAGLEEGLFPHFNSFDTLNGIEEERRLMYVAMTRAKRNLFITSAASRKRYGTGSLTVKSRFISELETDETETKKEREILQKNIHLTDYYGIEGAKEMAEEYKENKKQTGLSIGDRVNHPFYGKGRVLSLKGSGEDTIATVSFQSGETKKIFLQYANMKRI